MDINKVLITIKGADKTKDVQSVNWDAAAGRYQVTFANGKTYSYMEENIAVFENPVEIAPASLRIERQGKLQYGLAKILRFETWYRLFYNNGFDRAHPQEELVISQNALSSGNADNCFDYLKQMAELVGRELNKKGGEEEKVEKEKEVEENPDPAVGVNILQNRYDKINFVGSDTVLAAYLNPSPSANTGRRCPKRILFPYGCNRSQKSAVTQALSHQVSVIQGPPGTGKTQTILNIIANLLMQKKTVIVVSNNNSATQNVEEKLADPSNDLGFVAAMLGKADNKEAFLKNQTGRYPDWSGFALPSAERKEKEKNYDQYDADLDASFIKQEALAAKRQELSELELEADYFKRHCENIKAASAPEKTRRFLTAKKALGAWHRCESMQEQGKPLPFWFKFKCAFVYGVYDWAFYDKKPQDVIPVFQQLFYRIRKNELKEAVAQLEDALRQIQGRGTADGHRECAMALLKDALYDRYGGKQTRQIFSADDLWKDSQAVNREYPVVLSTTYSAVSSLGRDYLYDYLIMDEASQVDVVTGALALSCAKNAVIVGDTMQLPNVVTREVGMEAERIFSGFKIPDSYNFVTHSFLESILDTIPDVPQTLLREHYRCHPQIIQFCNQKFYHNQLLVMTEDRGEPDVLKVYTTVPGSHERERLNQRQIDEITQEIVPELLQDGKREDIGIIAPFNKQVDGLKREGALKDIDIATVHKFQGREKDDIIISTVENEISDFTDNANLLNVAVSRARKRLRLIVAEGSLKDNRNITDLARYVTYHNFDIVQGKVNSIFDYLYREYAVERRAYLKDKQKVSEFDSENLMNALIDEVLKQERFSKLGTVFEQPLSTLIGQQDLLTEEEAAYVNGGLSHVDFLVFNRMDKTPVLAMEVDGWRFHKEGTEQYDRDRMKDRILEKYGIPLERFVTNQSGERERLEKRLEDILGLSAASPEDDE